MTNSDKFIRSRSGQAEALATGRTLIKAGLLTESQLSVVLKQMQAMQESGHTVFIEQMLSMNRFVSHGDIMKALDNKSGSSRRGLFRTILPIEVCERFGVMPVRVINDVLEIKSCRYLSPSNQLTIIDSCIEKIEFLKIIPVSIVEIKEIHRNYSAGEFSFEQILSVMRTTEINGIILRQAINILLNDSIKKRASDVRLEKKSELESWISHRIDGVYHQTYLVPEKIMAAMFTRLKNDCDMDASQTRIGQDGRISTTYKGRPIDFRVNTLPVEGGESMTMRVLDEESVPNLEGLFPNQLDMSEMFNRVAKVKGKQGGIIIFSGPTGSGKSTSLYSLAQRFPRDQMNLITLENPIEFKLPLTRQIQINDALEQKMSDIERNILRQDPDAIIISEIRDADGMKAGLHFAQSGHLLISTIHASDIEQTIGRILSFLGSEGREDALYMLANTLRVIINQSLVPRLCSCATVVDASEADKISSDLEKNGIFVKNRLNLRKKIGCLNCSRTGYINRVAVHETLIIPTDRTLRLKLAEMMLESVANFSVIRNMEGVTYKSYKNTFEKLLDGGVIDSETAILNLRQEYT
jgi:type II secretory ATPase GspE/PulE/Tfp pilus assembly ATPase PilB-like protein